MKIVNGLLPGQYHQYLHRASKIPARGTNRKGLSAKSIQTYAIGLSTCLILYDQQQNPVDLLFTDANLAAKKITGKSNFNGLRASSLGLDFSSNLLQLTTLSPNKDYLDDTHFVSRINKYFHFISYMTRPDEVIYLFSDITETFNTHQALDAVKNSA